MAKSQVILGPDTICPGDTVVYRYSGPVPPASTKWQGWSNLIAVTPTFNRDTILVTTYGSNVNDVISYLDSATNTLIATKTIYIRYSPDTTINGPGGPYCGGAQYQFDVNPDPNITSYQWIATGGIVIDSGATDPLVYVTLNGFGTLTIRMTTNEGCTIENSRTLVPNATGPSVTIFTEGWFCETELIRLDATPVNGGRILVYDSVNGSLIGQAPVDTLLPPGMNYTFTYYEQDPGTGCLSDPRTAAVNVASAPQPPTGINDTICAPGVGSIEAITTTGNVNWYNSPTSGSLVTTGSPFSFPASSTTTYYAGHDSAASGPPSGACSSVRVPVTLFVGGFDSLTSVPSLNSCGPTFATLTATATPGAIVSWYSDPGLNTLVNNGLSFNNGGFPFSSSTTYYLEAIDTLNCAKAAQIVSVMINTPPTASPAVNLMTACAPAMINFTDNSTSGSGAINTWNWTFGDGGNSNQANPTYTYNTGGNYTVTLIVNDANGCADTATLSGITINNPPLAGFTAPTTVQCPNLPVSFQDTSTSGSAPVNSWNWTFGNGDTGSGQVVSNTYNAPGTYTVELIITDTNNCSDTATQNAYITILDTPAVSFSPSANNGCGPLTINFTDNSTLPNPGNATWSWAFGDGGTSSLQNPSYTYNIPGTYPVTLIITDNTIGCADTLAATSITVFSNPTANFSSPDTLACASQLIQFTDSSIAGISSWSWNFGDGSTDSVSNPSHTYPGSGSYTITLSVIDSNGCSDTLSRLNYIQISQPIAGFSADYLQGCTPLSVTFSDASSPSLGGPIINWVWDFGDGNNGSGNPVSNTYTEIGTFTVGLIIEDAIGCRDTVTFADYISTADLSGVSIINTTVISRTENEITFSAYNGAAFAQYSIFDSTRNLLVATITNINDTVYIDNVGNTETTNHCYTVTIQDTCGRVSTSTEHCTIELQAQGLNEAVQLDWTAYQGWNVDSYEIYSVGGYGTSVVTLLATVDGGTTSYIDTTGPCDSIRLYRIRATQNGGNQNSWSDVASATKICPTLCIPNTITPNGDAWNEYFETCHNGPMSIKIFNRWGNLVYETDNYQNDWNGINNDNEQLPGGVYFYILTLETDNEKVPGYVNVIR